MLAADVAAAAVASESAHMCESHGCYLEQYYWFLYQMQTLYKNNAVLAYMYISMQHFITKLLTIIRLFILIVYDFLV